jgi:PAS domain S-box-containing protein
VTDTTDRTAVEMALRASEERFRTLVRFSFDVYWETDAQHRFTRQEFSGDLADAPAGDSEIGKTRWEVPYLEPDEEAWRQHRATLEAHLPFRDFELARPTPDGGRRYVSVSGVPVFDETGRFTGYRGVGRHITERKRADEEHRAHLWFLESMDRINRAMQRASDGEGMMGDVLDAVLELFACDRAWLIHPCDPAAPSWSPAMERTRPEFPGAFTEGARFPVDADIAALFAAARASDRVVHFSPGPGRSVPAVAERFAIRSQLAMAVHPKGAEPYLFGIQQCSGPRVWTAVEERLFQEIGRRLGDALTSLLVVRTLRESERKLEAAQRIARVGYWERDLVNGRVALSEETLRIFGLPPDERVTDLAQWHARWQAFIDPEDRPRVLAAVAAALAGGPRYDVEFRIVRASGERRVVHTQGDVIRDASGRPALMFGTQQDITELRRAEDERRASEARFRTFVDHATDAFFLHDDDLTVIEVNRHACEALGYSREELIGMHPRQFDAGLDERMQAELAERVRAGETVTFETRHRRKDGREFPVEIRARQFHHGTRPFHLSLVRDISERKRAERRSATQHAVAQILAEATTMDEATPRVLQAVCEGLDWDLGTLWRIDREAGVLRCGQVWRRAALGAGPFEAVTRETAFASGVGLPGRVWATRMPACIPDVAHDPTFLRAGEAARAGLRAAFAFPILLGGEVLGVIDVLSRDVRQSDQDLLDMMASLGSQIGQFIERKRAEDALRIAQSEVAHLARVMTMGELTASIAHEVNQPLLGIVSSAASCSRWLAAQPPNLPRAQRALERIMEAGTRASAVIDRVRTLVRRQPLRTGPVDLNEIVREAVAMVRHELQRSGVALKTRLAADVPAVPGDRVQLQQVVLNLILNAIEAARAVEGHAGQVWVASRLEPGQAVHVEVRDSGVGLAPDSRARVFEAFYTTKASGLGMGLSICKSIVEAHGGRISARPNSPHGAVFQFWLPLVSADADGA